MTPSALVGKQDNPFISQLDSHCRLQALLLFLLSPVDSIYCGSRLIAQFKVAKIPDDALEKVTTGRRLRFDLWFFEAIIPVPPSWPGLENIHFQILEKLLYFLAPEIPLSELSLRWRDHDDHYPSFKQRSEIPAPFSRPLK
ncbi:unnamed protein product [Nezara viridula]|uniref:Uncharacterized protein n=1 Tax=Nezara viridula TaxID=85310 RepID=A0A9P0HC73_NEZVI|nr:unnamed protein product [Nezara viridula]